MNRTASLLAAAFIGLASGVSNAQVIFSSGFEPAAPAPPPISVSAVPLSTASSDRLEFMDEQLSWYLNQPYNDLNTWMYDRVQVLYEHYLRTGDEQVHAEATRSAQEYVKHYTRNGGRGGWPDCNGGWSHANVNKCDSKFTYVAALYYLDKVDGIVAYDDQLLEDIEEYLMAAGYNVTPGPIQFDTRVTERNWGVTLMGLAYLKLLGSPTAEANIDNLIGWLWDWQQTPPGSDPFTGAWLHSFSGHEGGGPDHRTFSTWQSAILVGGLWRLYQVQPDERIAKMVVDFAQAMEDLGYIDSLSAFRDSLSASQAQNFPSRHGFNESGMGIWYLALPFNFDFSIENMKNSGWYADLHLPEVQCVTAAGYYFSTDAAQRQAFRTRYEQIEPFYNSNMATVRSPARLFAWQHSHNASCEWMMEQ